MLLSQRVNSRYTLGLTALLLSCALPLIGATRPDDYIARAMQFFRTLYPGLKNVKAVTSDESDLNNRAFPDIVNAFTMTLREGPFPGLDPRDPWRSRAVLWGHFYFDHQTKQLRDVLLGGPFIDDRLDKLAKQVEKHPEWPDGRVIQALKAAGAKFGPDDKAAFLRTLPLKDLEPFIGSLEVISAEFTVRLAPAQGERPKTDLQWGVEAKCHSEDGRYEANCFLSFEPFDGFLMAFSLRSPLRQVRR